MFKDLMKITFFPHIPFATGSEQDLVMVEDRKVSFFGFVCLGWFGFLCLCSWNNL